MRRNKIEKTIEIHFFVFWLKYKRRKGKYDFQK